MINPLIRKTDHITLHRRVISPSAQNEYRHINFVDKDIISGADILNNASPQIKHLRAGVHSIYILTLLFPLLQTAHLPRKPNLYLRDPRE